jgi:hypothetical protein
MKLHRGVGIAIAALACAACQPATDSGTDRSAETQTPVAEAMPDESSAPEPAADPMADFAWTLPDHATEIDGRANIYLAGQAADAAAADPAIGLAPPAIEMTDAGSIRFDLVEGRVGCAGSLSNGPDGGDCVSAETRVDASNGFSASTSTNRSLFLVGVFPVMPDPAVEVEVGVAPESDSALLIEPKANQVFLIGDGRTADGALQVFVKPAGASRLYLGFADAFGFFGAPGAYDDNVGRLRLGYTLNPGD